jgi:hypothetical protein
MRLPPRILQLPCACSVRCVCLSTALPYYCTCVLAYSCRHDTPAGARVVLRETKHYEGTMAELRANGAPSADTAFPDGDAAAQVFQVRRWRHLAADHHMYRNVKCNVEYAC